MKRIAIIGANSYIARNMIVFLKSNYSDIELKLYDYSDSHADGEKDYKKINILDSASVRAIDMNCDIIYFFVGKTGSANGFDDYDTFVDINEKALLCVLNEYRTQNSKAKIVFPSTRLVYKGAQGALSEDAQKEFKTIYAMNKFSCENYLYQYSNVFDVRYCIFRICVPYGTLVENASSYGTAEFMLSKAMAGNNITLYGDGCVRRTITHMHDLCNTLVAGGFSDECINDVYNIGGEDYSLAEMALAISSKYNIGIDYVEWPQTALKIESGDTVFDDAKLRNIIGNTINHRFIDWINKECGK